MICIWSCLPRQFGTKCSGCLQGISPSDLVRHARAKVFHLKCFTCATCRKQLSTGEELFVINENQFVCKEDYLNGSSEYIIESIMKFLYFSMEFSLRYKSRSCLHECIYQSFEKCIFDFRIDASSLAYWICANWRLRYWRETWMTLHEETRKQITK